MRRYILWLIIGVCLSFVGMSQYVQAQDKLEWRNWNNLGFSIKLAPSVNMALRQTYGFDFGPYELDWMQNSFGINALLNKKHSLGLRYTQSIIFRSDENNHKHRFVAAYGIKSKLGIWRIANNVLAEYHSKEETKYRARIIYIFRIRPRNDLLIPSIKLTPYFSSFLYYNIGGRPIAQFDSKQEYLGDFVPYGWHRLRLTLGFACRPSNSMSLSVQATRQMEFNTDFAGLNKMNVYNPIKERIVRSFKHYYILSFSIKHYLSFAKKKQKSKSTFNYIPNRNWYTSPTDYDF